jgi:RHS repeat-associated protein
MVEVAGDGHGPLIPPIPKATHNGYVYVYLSNETPNMPVYFDNFQVSHTRGQIVEDNAYYPFGLKIQGISARAAGKAKTKEGYQGDYNEQDDETGYNEFALRFYDPQIGRWLQVDPKIIEPGMYNGMGNDPINQIDPDGGGPDDWFAGIINGSLTIVQDIGNHSSSLMQGGVALQNIGGDALSITEAGTVASYLFGGIPYTALLQGVTVGGIASKFTAPTEPVIPIKSNLKCHPDNTYLEIERQRIAIEYSKLDFKNGQVDFPRSKLAELFFGPRGFSGTNPVTGVSYTNVALDKNGYLTNRLVPITGTVDVGFSGIGSLKKIASFEAEVGAGAGALDGSFSITKLGWQGYPAGMPKPQGPFRLLQGEEYASARAAANNANKKISSNLGLKNKFVDVHEINPVKFGGSPTNVFNKVFLDRTFHQTQVNPFWKKIQDGIQ